MSENTITQDNRCTGCGGQLRFDPESQALKCASCGEAPVTGIPQSATTPATLECPNCAAELEIIPGTRQARCGFCGGSFNTMREDEDCVLTGEIPEDHKFIVPFTVSQEDYQKGVISWLANEKNTPTDIFDKMAIVRTGGYYIPYYYCTVHYRINWTASIGVNRIETYTDFETRRDAKGNSYTVPVTRTRVVIDWYPFASELSGRVTNACEAANYLETVAQKTHAVNCDSILVGVESSRQGLNEAVENLTFAIAPNREGAHRELPVQPYDAKFTTGFTLTPCDFPADKVYDKAVFNRKITNDIKQAAPGDHIRDIRFTGDYVADFYMIHRPHWLSIYSYGSNHGCKLCFQITSGTNASQTYGTRPVCIDQKRRIRRWFIGFGVSLAFALLLCFIAFAGRVVALEPFAVLSLAASGGLGITTLIVRAVLLSKSKKHNIAVAEQYLSKPSMIFSKKSAKADPTI